MSNQTSVQLTTLPCLLHSEAGLLFKAANEE